MRPDGLPEGGLEHPLRGRAAEGLRADGPEVAVEDRDELAELVDPSVAPFDHLAEDRGPEPLVIRRQAVLHVRLDAWPPASSDPVEQLVEIRHIEIDRLPERAGIVEEVDLEAESRGAEAILDGAAVPRAPGGGLGGPAP